MSKDYYKALGVEKNASADEIKKAFKKAAMQHHPDLDIRYTKITATLSTHDVGGITKLDIALAHKMETLAG